MDGNDPRVDAFFSNAKKWKEELEKLRVILLDFPLAEELKWREPCYTFEGKNVVIISGFKDYCLLGFFKGALLNDPQGILIRQGENTQSARQIRFTSVQEIAEMEPVLKQYVRAAIEVEIAGLKVKLKETAEYPVPDEFQSKLDVDPALKTAFQALTPGRQRAYLLYFASAKQSKTRETRIEKYMQKILDGKGMND